MSSKRRLSLEGLKEAHAAESRAMVIVPPNNIQKALFFGARQVYLH